MNPVKFHKIAFVLAAVLFFLAIAPAFANAQIFRPTPPPVKIFCKARPSEPLVLKGHYPHVGIFERVHCTDGTVRLRPWRYIR